jgi:carboxyl-terminal processing protease
LIIKINDKATKGMNLSDAVKLMRGKPKTSIELTISRKGVNQPIVLTIVRDVIKVQSVKSSWVAPGYAYVRIAQFQEHTVENLVTHLNKQLASAQSNPKQPVKGIILDLRNDPGGLLHSAVGVSAAFLKGDQVVVTTDGRQPDAKRSFRTRPEDFQRGGRDPLAGLSESARSLPMVVLVNAGSASASEIVAGALQDHGRAKVIGTQTFGKGSVQTILPLTSNTAIKLTTARYYTPKGRSIQAKGIRPDYWVEETAEGDITDRFRLREADLNRHLGNGQGKEEGSGNAAQRSQGQGAVERKPLVFGSPEDHQLKQAIALLQGQPVATNPAPPEAP